jgi:hypothetical protein
MQVTPAMAAPDSLGFSGATRRAVGTIGGALAVMALGFPWGVGLFMGWSSSRFLVSHSFCGPSSSHCSLASGTR